MSFLAFIVLLVLGFIFIDSSSIFSKLIGVVLLCCAFNPLCIALTGQSIPTTVQKVWHTGEKVYDGTKDTLSKVREKVKG
jgi:hypothetical protein